MNKYVRSFLHRGLIFSGLGPVVAGIVYLILELSHVEIKINGFDLFLAIITTYIIAFVQAGSSVFKEIETWGVAKQVLFQMTSIYVVYFVGYLINHWIPFNWIVIVIFTSIFVATFLSIWFTAYFISKKVSKKLNERLLIENGGNENE